MMTMKKITLTLFVLFLPLQYVMGQSWQDYYAQVVSMDDVESTTWEETSQLLSELEQHPLNFRSSLIRR